MAAWSMFLATRSIRLIPSHVSFALIIAAAEQTARECGTIGSRRFLPSIGRAHPLDEILEFVIG